MRLKDSVKSNHTDLQKLHEADYGKLYNTEICKMLSVVLENKNPAQNTIKK